MVAHSFRLRGRDGSAMLRAMTDTGDTGARRAATMESVGRLAGVSQVTVSRALRDPGKVSPATLRRIEEAIALTGFVPNALAGALASNRSRLVSALAPSVTNPMYSHLIKAFGAPMRAAGYEILFSETGHAPEEEERVIRAHLSRRPDAMLLIGIRRSAQTRRMLLGAAIPVLELWDLTDTPIDICVGFSHAEVARAAARFLRDLGHRSAATITAVDERAARRRDGFAAEFARLGGAPVLRADTGADATIAGGRAAFAALMEGAPPRAVFCSSDVLAHGAMIEAQARGLRVPGEVAIMGFGDQEFAAHLEPALTTVRVDRAAIGARAADEALARLDGHGPTGPRTIDLGFEIIRRASA